MYVVDGELSMIHHVALQYPDKEAARVFFAQILGLHLMKAFTVSAELSQKIFKRIEAVEVVVYGDGFCRFEVFIAPVVEKTGFEHIGIELQDKQGFIRRCETYGVEPWVVKKDGKELLFVKDFVGNLFEVKERPTS
jgi:catechol 2,3-dioxygenase-like lactoylglutathione lyase family enzyme